jgi:hypothetical protein
MCLRLQNVSRYESLSTQATFCCTICTKDMCVDEQMYYQQSLDSNHDRRCLHLDKVSAYRTESIYMINTVD